MSRLEKQISVQGMIVFSRINHTALAAETGMTLRPTEVILFGNPRGGTPLMQANQTVGIDLPLRALVWQDASGKTWISYNDAAWLVKRHELVGVDRAVGMMQLALEEIVSKAARDSIRAQSR